MLTHQKELISQNAEKMLSIWPNAPMGIYSASLGKREAGYAITFAGIQSVRQRADLLGHRDLVLIDECHLMSTENMGWYRRLIDALIAINPALRVIGLTATPYRLGQGLLTEGDNALFSEIVAPTSIAELVALGYLAPLRSKVTDAAIDTAGVKKRGGEYVEADLARAADHDDLNAAIAFARS